MHRMSQSSKVPQIHFDESVPINQSIMCYAVDTLYICPVCPNLILESDSKIPEKMQKQTNKKAAFCEPGRSNHSPLSCLSSDDLSLPVAVSLHPPVPAVSGRRPQRSLSIYSGCGLPLLWPLRPPARCCLCGSGHQHYLPVCCALKPISLPNFCSIFTALIVSNNCLKYCVNAFVKPRGISWLF